MAKLARTPVTRTKIAKLMGARVRASGQRKVAVTDPRDSEIADLRARIETLENDVAVLMETIQVEASGDVVIHSASDMTINAANDIAVNANLDIAVVAGAQSTSINLNSTGNLTLQSVMSANIQTTNINFDAALLNATMAIEKHSGTIDCNTLIAKSVAGESYTPGAGNIW